MLLVYAGSNYKLLKGLSDLLNKNGVRTLSVLSISKNLEGFYMEKFGKINGTYINIIDEYKKRLKEAEFIKVDFPINDLVARDRYTTYEDVFSWWYPRRFVGKCTYNISKALFLAWKYILNNFQIDSVIVIDDFASMIIHTLYLAALYENIPTAFMTPHIKGGYMFSITPLNESIITLLNYRNPDKINTNYFKDAEKFIENFRNKPSSPHYMKNVPRKLRIMFRERGKWVERIHAVMAALKLGVKKREYYPFYNLFKEIPRTRVNRILNLIYLKSIKMNNIEEIQGKRFFLYTLHYQPEAASIYRNWFWDQYDMLKTLVRYIPDKTILAVKDHYAFFGATHRKIYKLASKLPNTVIINPFENIHKLILDSEGIVVYSNTTGFEAIMLGKPVLSIGRTYYSFFECVRRANNVNDIWNFFNNPQFDCKHDEFEKQLLTFVAAYLSSYLDFDIEVPQREENLKSILVITNFLKSIDNFKEFVTSNVNEVCTIYPYIC